MVLRCIENIMLLITSCYQSIFRSLLLCYLSYSSFYMQCQDHVSWTKCLSLDTVVGRWLRWHKFSHAQVVGVVELQNILDVSRISQSGVECFSIGIVVCREFRNVQGRFQTRGCLERSMCSMCVEGKGRFHGGSLVRILEHSHIEVEGNGSWLLYFYWLKTAGYLT